MSDLERFSRLLAVQPHPDDNDLAIGGTVARLAGGGAWVGYLTVTDGSAGSRDPGAIGPSLARRRRDEQRAAARLLGVADLFFLDHADGAVADELGLRSEILTIIRETRPDLVLMPDPWLAYEAHPDHRITGHAAAAAAALAHLPGIPGGKAPPHEVGHAAFYWTERANTHLRLTPEAFDRKVEAVRCHASQFAPEEAEAFLRRQHAGENPAAEHLLILARESLHISPFAAPRAKASLGRSDAV